MEAEINGPQRKIVSHRVRPLRLAHGTEGIPVRNGRTLPFSVLRAWSAPEGYYPEQWFLVNPETREVLYEGPVREALIWGLQSLTEITDEVRESIDLAPGTYLIVFSLDRLMGGQVEVQAVEVPAEEAA